VRIVLLLALTACQTYAGGMAALCQAPDRCGEACLSADGTVDRDALWAHLDRTVTHRRARGLLEGLARSGTGGGEVVREAASEAGLPSCPLVDTLTVQPAAPVPLPHGSEGPMRIVLLLALTSCQSYAAGMSALCRVPETCGAPCQTGDAVSRQAALARHVEDRVSNGAAKRLVASLASADPATRARLLREEAAKAGVEDCPLAEAYGGEGSGG
jgi:hypothetical protein